MNFCGKIHNNLIISKRYIIRMKPPPETTGYSLQFVQILEILFCVQLLEAGLKMQTPLKICTPICSLFLLILLLATQYALFLQLHLPPCCRNSQCDMPFQMPLRWRFDWKQMSLWIHVTTKTEFMLWNVRFADSEHHLEIRMWVIITILSNFAIKYIRRPTHAL